MIKPDIQAKLVTALLRLNLSTDNSRQALLISAGLDSNLVNSIDCSQAPSYFAAQAMRQAISYGNLRNGVNAVDAILQVVQDQLGSDGQLAIEELRNEWRAELWNVAARDSGPGNLTGAMHILPADPPLKIVRDCLDESFSNDTLLSFCQVYFPTVYRRQPIPSSFDHTIRDLLEYCQQQGRMRQLWDILQIQRPDYYDKYFPLWVKATGR